MKCGVKTMSGQESFILKPHLQLPDLGDSFETGVEIFYACFMFELM